MLNVRSSPSNSANSSKSDLHQWIDHDDDVGSLNTGLILHPQTGIFPFPSYFKELHCFLIRFTKVRLEDRYHGLQSSLSRDTSQKISPIGLEHCFSNKSEYSTSQIDIAAEVLPSLLPSLDEEGVYLLLYHLEPLFTNYETRLYAFTHLFDTLAQCLGPKSTLKTFLKPLIELCDSRLLQNYEHLAAQSFLSQIIVRFGLEVFLAHFVNFAVDAVAFELMLEKKKQCSDRISVHSNEGITADAGEVEGENKKQLNTSAVSKRSSYLTDDDAQLSDQEEEEFINRYDDLDEQNGISKRLFTCEEDEEDAGSQEDTSASEIGGLVVLTKESSNDLNDEEEVLSRTDYPVKCVSGVEKQGENNREPAKDDVAKGTGILKEDEREEKEDENDDKMDQEIDSDVLMQLKGESSSDETFETHDVTDTNTNEPSVPQDEDNPNDRPSQQDDEDEPLSADDSSEDSSDDEKSDTFGEEEPPETNQSDCPSADVFYQDTKAQDTKTTEQNKEELSPLYVSGIAAESVMWLAPRLGPVLTSQYLVKQLLTMLPQCYMDVVGVEEFELEDEDRKAKWVLYCLGNFCALYGEAFVLHQYLPFAEKIVSTWHSLCGIPVLRMEGKKLGVTFPSPEFFSSIYINIGSPIHYSNTKK